MSTDESAYRTRLEGKAELLEATLLRYRALVNALGALRWKQALRKQAALAREVAQAQPAVDEALAAVQRRAGAEGWSRRSAVVRCADDVLELREKIEALVAKRLGETHPAGLLGDRLATLERLAADAARVILPGQRWATAVELLPPGLAPLHEAAKFGALLESVFKRPEGLTRQMPFEVQELAALEQAFPQGEAALEALWEKLRAVDAAGTLTRHLRKLSRRMPMHPAKNGAEQLLATEFWKELGLSRLGKRVAARVVPLEPRPHELFALARWLVAVERDPEVRLAASARLSEARAGLFEVAQLLNASPPGLAAPTPLWNRLEERAERADTDPADPDLGRVRDNLRLLLRVVTQSQRGDEGDASLRELVVTLRRLAAR